MEAINSGSSLRDVPGLSIYDPKNKESVKTPERPPLENLDELPFVTEVYKRFLVPTYIPILILVSLILIIKSKENINYTKYRIFIFLSGISLIIFSETTQKFVSNSLEYNFGIFVMPIIIFIIFYLLVFYTINFKPKKNIN